MTRSVLALVILVTVSVSAMAQSTAPDTVNEPRSGTPFPLSLTPPGGTTSHWIMGTAIRQRTIFRVKIYAFGLYVDPESARASLSRFAGVSASTLERDESFYRQLLDLDFAMTLRLVMTRTVLNKGPGHRGPREPDRPVNRLGGGFELWHEMPYRPASAAGR